MSKKIVLIDGHSILTRAFFGVPDMKNSQGLHTNAIYGFLNIMFKILAEEKPDFLGVAFDVKAPTFRHKMFDGYKGTRKPMPDELHEQVPVIQELLSNMQIKVMTKEGYEADDILGTMARKAEQEGFSVVVVSGDRDLLQLATDKTLIRIPKTKKGGTEIENYYAADVKALYGVTPIEFIDMKGLMGDTSDNIPGVKSIGEKTAAKLIIQYQSIENIYANIDSVKPDRARNALIADEENAKLSKILATIDTDIPIDVSVAECQMGDLYNTDAYQMIRNLGFKSMLNKFHATPKEQENFSLSEQIQTISSKQSLDKWFVELGYLDKNIVIGYAAAFFENTAVITVLYQKQQYVLETSPNLEKAELSTVLERLYQLGNEIAVFDLKKHLKNSNFAYRENEEPIFDCMIAAYLLSPMDAVYDYDVVAARYLGIQLQEKTSVLGKKTIEAAYFEKKEDVINLLMSESYAAVQLCQILRDKLVEVNMLSLYRQMEYPLIFVLNEMEQEGILVDAKALKDYGEELAVRITQLENEIYQDTGETFNLNSPKQLGVVLFENMGLKGGKKTKTGYSTSAEVLEKLASEVPVVQKILEYRQLSKLKSTYADGLSHCISEDGRIYGSFHQTITVTGRISSTEPNLQNIPIRMEIGKRVREVFIAKEGCTFVDADYSQIELRILAHMSGDEHLIEAYNSEQDIHKITASEVFHVPLDEVTAELRRNAKAVNFGIVYGISSFGLSQDLSIGKKEAQEYINQYFETYPKVKEFLDKTVADAKEKGYTSTLYERRRPIPELKSSNFMTRSFGERAAMNAPVQGSAADIMKIAMIRVYLCMKKEKLKSKILLQVHDELLIEAYDEEVEKVKAIVSEEMANAANLSVKLEVGLESGKNWLEAH